MTEKVSFHWADYLVFGLSLFLSLAIGVYFAYKDRYKATTEEFLMGGRKLSIIPVGLSLVASMLSAIFIIGIPAEIYYFGAMFAIGVLGIAVVSGAVVCLIFVPTFQKMKSTSAYEYFDMRYDFPPLRKAVSLTFILNLIFYMAVVLYVPAFAFSEVTGLSMVTSILASGVVCTIYTALGGMKAVVWTDTLQVGIIFVGMMVLCIAGIYDEKLDGPGKVLDRAYKGNRMDLTVDTWDTDPRTRHTMFSQIIGSGVTYMAAMGANQMTVQRYMSVSNVRRAQGGLLVAIFVAVGIFVIDLFIAWTMYAYYYDCDPLIEGRISKGDQIVPLFFMDILGDMHGLPGLFTAAVFAAALSTVSSALNSLAAVVLEDFIRPIYTHLKNDEISHKGATNICKVIAVLFGVVTVGLSFIAEHLGDNIVLIPSTVWGIAAAPLFGVFFLSLFVPWATGPGCLTGLVVSLVLTMWIGVGGIFHGKDRIPLMPLGFCIPDAIDSTINTTISSATTSRGAFQYMYDISYAWYGVIGTVVCVIVGVVASLVNLLLIGKSLREKTAEVDPSLMYNWADSCCCCFPAGVKKFMQAGVRFDDERSLEKKTGDRQMNGIQNEAFDTAVNVDSRL